MAMRPRPRGITPPRPRLPIAPVYEDFKPMAETKEEQEYNTLLVHLPGFMREQVKVTVETSAIIKAYGERPIGNNRRSRFNQDFRIPENCNVSGITAKFDDGLLTITMPKKIVSQIAPEQVSKTTQEAPIPPKVTPPTGIGKQRDEQSAPSQSQKGQEDTPLKATTTTGGGEKQRYEETAQFPSPQKPKSQKVEEDSPPKATTTTGGGEKQRYEKSAQSPTPQKPKSQKVEEDSPPKATTSTGGEKQRYEKSAQSPSPQKPKSQKVEEDTPPKATTTTGGEKETEKKSVKAPEPKSQKGEEKTPLEATTEKQIIGEKSAENVVQKTVEKKERIETKEKATESKKNENAVEKTLEKEKEGGEKSKESMTTATEFVERFVQKDKEKNDGSAPDAAKAKETKNVTAAAAGDGGGFKRKKNEKAGMKDRPKKMSDEDKQSLVNMGVAIVVIVALGAYISYFGTSGKTNN